MCPSVIPLRQPQGLEAALRYQYSPSTNGADAVLLFPFILAEKKGLQIDN
jgi:hypothetical protein